MLELNAATHIHTYTESVSEKAISKAPKLKRVGFRRVWNSQRMSCCIADIDPSIKGDLLMAIRCLRKRPGSSGARGSGIAFELVELYLLEVCFGVV